MKRYMMAAFAAFFLLIPATSYARGKCDGIHRCICGSTQARHFGLPRIYNGYNLWQAREWGRAFPRTTAHAGAVAVWPHHVARIVQPLENGKAIVADERGTYERSIRTAVLVDPNGNGLSNTGSPAVNRKYRARDVTGSFAQQERYRPL